MCVFKNTFDFTLILMMVSLFSTGYAKNKEVKSYKDKSLIEQNSLVTAIAVISWKGISIISLWAFIILISIRIPRLNQLLNE